MVMTGIAPALLPGLFNGLFTTPVKFELRWSWENIGLVEVVVSCLAMPSAVLSFSASGWFRVLGQAPGYGVVAALLLVCLRFWRDPFWQEHPHYTASLLFMPGSSAPWARGSAMGLLRGGSIFLTGLRPLGWVRWDLPSVGCSVSPSAWSLRILWVQSSESRGGRLLQP